MEREQIIWISTCVKSYATDFIYIRKLVSVASLAGERNVKLEELASLRLLLFLGAVWMKQIVKNQWFIVIAVGIQKRTWDILYLDLSEWGRVRLYTAFKSRRVWRVRHSQLVFSTFLELMPCFRHMPGPGAQSWRKQSCWQREAGCHFLVGKARAGHMCPSTLGGRESWQKYLLVAWLGVTCPIAPDGRLSAQNEDAGQNV